MQHDRQTKGQFVFGDFVLTLEGALLSAGRQQMLPPKEHSVLVVLLSAPGKLLSKDVLLDQVWGVDTVSEESLTRCIYVLRRLLNDNKGTRYIDTVYGKGYRFSHAVSFTPALRPVTPRRTLAQELVQARAQRLLNNELSPLASTVKVRLASDIRQQWVQRPHPVDCISRATRH